MTYLNYLEQTLNTPVANYHECALKRKKTATCIEFFELSSVQDSWIEISELGEKIYKDESASTKQSHGDEYYMIDGKRQKPDSIKLSLNHLYLRVELEKEKYDLLKRQNNFSIEDESTQLLTHSGDYRASSETSNLSEELEDDSLNRETSGVEFLLSISGMFSSGDTERTSSDIEDITAEILQKHERKKQ